MYIDKFSHLHRLVQNILDQDIENVLNSRKYLSHLVWMLPTSSLATILPSIILGWFLLFWISYKWNHTASLLSCLTPFYLKPCTGDSSILWKWNCPFSVPWTFGLVQILAIFKNITMNILRISVAICTSFSWECPGIWLLHQRL